MKIEINIDENELRKEVMQRVAGHLVDAIFNGDNNSLPYEKREALRRERLEGLMAKIDWKNAGAQLSETVIQKFFMNLLDRPNR